MSLLLSLISSLLLLCNDTSTTEIYTYGHTLSLHDALPIAIPPGWTSTVCLRGERSPLPVTSSKKWPWRWMGWLIIESLMRFTRTRSHSMKGMGTCWSDIFTPSTDHMNSSMLPVRWMSRSEEHTSEIQSLMRISYAD